MNGAMSMIRRFLAGLFMALMFSSSAHAADPVMQFRVRSVPESVPWVAVPVDACSLAIPHRFTFPEHWSFTHLGTGSPPLECFYYNTPDNYTQPQTLDNRLWCPGSDTAPINGQCEDTCTVGASQILTFGSAWASSPEDIPDSSTFNLPPASWCDGSCMHDFNTIISVDIDDDPSANGYYEITTTNEYISTGATCGTASEPPENPDPGPPCGDGNCTPDPDDGDGDGDDGGGGDPGGGDGDGDGDGDNPGGENPGDGAGGDGDGDGDGDGSGGGSGPGSGDGDGEGEEEGGGKCGIPGKPACAVKLDETGTPDGSGTLNDWGDAVDNLEKDISDRVSDISSTNVYNPQWTWTLQFPTGCTPFVLSGYNLSIDVCQWQGIVHDIMSMLWVGATFWFLIGLFLRAEGG